MFYKLFWWMIGTNIVLLFFFFLSLFDIAKPSESLVTPSLQEQLSSSFTKTQSLIVQIIAHNKSDLLENTSVNQKSILKKGNGIVVSKKGIIITNNHIVDDLSLDYTIIDFQGKEFPVKKIWKDPLVDFAILSVDSNVFDSEASFISIDSVVPIGQFVFAIGNPFSEYLNTMSFGIISGKGRTFALYSGNNSYYGGLYQTDVALNPGNSGGPLVSLSGEILGMITAISRGGNNIGFALPLSKEFIKTNISILEEYNTLIRPYLGISYVDTLKGALVDTVFSDSPLKGKIFPSDIILTLDKRPISISTPLLYYIYIYKPGETVVFSIKRGDHIISIPLILTQKQS